MSKRRRLDQPDPSLDDLPPEVLGIVFSYLTVGYVLMSIRGVCRLWKAVIESPYYETNDVGYQLNFLLASISQYGCQETIRWLLGRKATWREYRTPLVAVSERGDIGVVRTLLDVAGNTDMIKRDGLIALDVAATNRHWDVAELLLEGLSDMGTAIAKRSRGVLLRYASQYGHNRIAKRLLEKWRVSGFRYSDIVFSLVVAAREGHVEILTMLLDHGADIHTEGDYPLVLASEFGKLGTVKLLLKRGAKTSKDALRRAIRQNHLRVVRELLDAGPNKYHLDGWALSNACISGNAEMVKILLEYGANLHKLIRDDHSCIRNGAVMRTILLAS